jgi:two-component system NarL family sensor kinase
MSTITHGTLIKATTFLDENYATQNPENDISIYRMVQELINNILKHAHVKKIEISSTYIDNQLLLTIFHDGNGLSQQQFEEYRYKKEGLGLKTIMNRIILLKGEITFSNATDGSRIIIHIPVKTIV